MSLIKRQRNDEFSDSTDNSQSDSFSLQGHDGTVLATKFNRNGEILASGGYDKKILLWNLPHTSSIDSANFGEIAGHKSAVTSLRWLDNGLLASSSADMTIGLWDTETGSRLRKFNSHSLVVNEVDTDSNLIASAGDDGYVYVWDQKSKSPVNSFKTEYPLLTIAFFKNIIYAAGIEPIIRAWDIRATEAPLFEIETLHSDTITSLAVDNSNLVSRSQDDTVRIYDPTVTPGNHIRESIFEGATAGKENLTIRCILRNNAIYSGSADNTVTIWDISSRRLLRKLQGHTGTVVDIDEYMGNTVSGSVDGSVILRYAKGK